MPTSRQSAYQNIKNAVDFIRKLCFSINSLFLYCIFFNQLVSYAGKIFRLPSFNPLTANPTKWSNTLKQFVDKLYETP